MDPQTRFKHTEFLVLKQMYGQLIGTFNFEAQEGFISDADFSKVLNTLKNFIKILIQANTKATETRKNLPQPQLQPVPQQHQQPSYIGEQFTQMENN